MGNSKQHSSWLRLQHTYNPNENSQVKMADKEGTDDWLKVADRENSSLIKADIYDCMKAIISSALYDGDKNYFLLRLYSLCLGTVLDLTLIL